MPLLATTLFSSKWSRVSPGWRVMVGGLENSATRHGNLPARKHTASGSSNHHPTPSITLPYECVKTSLKQPVRTPPVQPHPLHRANADQLHADIVMSARLQRGVDHFFGSDP